MISKFKQNLLTINNLTVKYGDVLALDNVSLNIEQGDFVALIGSNGAGKSSLLNVLSGFMPPTAGDAVYSGECLKRNPPYSFIGFSAQKIIIDWYLDVWSNVYLGALLAGASESEAVRLTERALGKVHLLHKSRAMVDELSGGEQQRVQIARAIAHEPDFYILDEPTTGLDAELAEKFFAFLQEENARGKTILVASHDLFLLEKYCSKLVYLSKGRVQYVGGLKDFFKQYYFSCQYFIGVRDGQVWQGELKPQSYTVLENKEAKNGFYIELKPERSLSDALLEIAAVCEIVEVTALQENRLRSFFVNNAAF